jgi:hypothetical protein
MNKLILVIVMIFWTTFVFANVEEPLPIAPKRSDDRDLLPTTPFVSLTGQDPYLPETEDGQGKRAIANTKKTAKPVAKKSTAKSPAVTATKSVKQKAVPGKKPMGSKTVASKKTATARKPAQVLPKKKTKK